MPKTWTITIAGLRREAPIIPVPSGVQVAVIRVLRDTELVVEAIRQLARLLPSGTQAIAGPETGGIVLAHQLSVETGLPYVAMRKKRKLDMGEPLLVEVQTIVSSAAQTLLLGEAEAARLRGKMVAVIDDVVSTGSTIDAMEKIVSQAGGQVIARLALATEGEPRDDVIALCHLPLFPLDM
jgi:adenine phosphoribosyltransferase